MRVGTGPCIPQVVYIFYINSGANAHINVLVAAILCTAMSTNHPIFTNKTHGGTRKHECNARMSALEEQLVSSERMFTEADEERRALRVKVRSLERRVSAADATEARIIHSLNTGFASIEATLGKLSNLPRQIQVLDADFASLSYRFAAAKDAQEKSQIQLLNASTRSPPTHVRSESRILSAVHADLQQSNELHHRAFAALSVMVEKSNTWIQQILTMMIREPVEQRTAQVELMRPILTELELISLASANL